MNLMLFCSITKKGLSSNDSNSTQTTKDEYNCSLGSYRKILVDQNLSITSSEQNSDSGI